MCGKTLAKSVLGRTEHCKNALSTSGGGLSRYIRSGPEYEKIVGGLGIALQPWLAKFGVLGCIIVFISASATWWSHPANAKNVIAAYGPVSSSDVLPILLCRMKLTAG